MHIQIHLQDIFQSQSDGEAPKILMENILNLVEELLKIMLINF
jgi:hypothetical protein